ncbi:MAG: peptide-methionine (R)-S-oxide reductase MsrB [Hyphomicrobiaceae bacterium]|nr:MAG: peptide-methionine (R)-S-oxide reductase MsrB [Hyphomicrobiaceae bacterium]
MLNRRNLTLAGAAGLIAAGIASLMRSSSTQAIASGGNFEVTRTDEEWRRILSPEAYYVLRKHGTERAGTSPLDKEHRPGTFACAGCDLPLFSSKTKYNSGTGWPSFYAPLENAIGTTTDRSWGMTRTEVHCRRCGGHLGHVFNDGPKPTGLRYCMNGVAMKFMPEEKSAS